MPFVIGIIGKPAAGKGTIVSLVKEITQREFQGRITVGNARFSDVLRERVRERGTPETRENLQKEAVDMEKEASERGEKLGALSRAVGKRVEAMKDSHLVIVDGVRWLTDEEMIRSFPQNRIIHVWASQRARFLRTIARKENVGDAQKTWEEFVREDEAYNERFVDEIGKRANTTLKNEEAPGYLAQMLTLYLRGWIFPSL